MKWSEVKHKSDDEQLSAARKYLDRKYNSRYWRFKRWRQRRKEGTRG